MDNNNSVALQAPLIKNSRKEKQKQNSHSLIRLHYIPLFFSSM